MTVLLGSLDDRDDWPDVGQCPIEDTLALLGTKSSMLLLREASYGTTRFDDFVRRVGLAKTLTSQRLSELVSAGLLTKRSYRQPGERRRQEYVLTAAGTAFSLVMWSMFERGRTHLDQDDPSQLQLIHLGCGARVAVPIRCARDHNVPADELGLRVSGERTRLPHRPRRPRSS